MFYFDEKKILFVKKLLISNPNRGVYSDVFNLFKDEIKELIDFGLKYKSILSLLEKELDYSLNYKTFISWVNKNIKQKNQSSNNTLRNNFQIKREAPKPLKQSNNRPWWEKEIERASKAMKEAALRL